MAHLTNKKSLAARQNSLDWPLVLLLFTAAITALSAPYNLDKFVASAQQATQERRTGKSRVQRAKTPAPSPTPTPSALDRLGPPPPLRSPSPKAEQEINPGDVISVNTTEVMLPVTVRDSNGRLVSELTRRGFRG